MATDFDTARDAYENYRYCYDNGHSDWVKLASMCFDYWSGKQWDDVTKARLALEQRPALTLNIIEPLIRAMKGIQRALRNDVRFSPVYDASLDTAKVRDALWLFTQQQNDFEFMETDAYVKGLIMGRAFYDVRVSFDESLQGDVKITKRRSQDVILDPSVDDYDPDSWPQVFTRRWVSVDDIRNTFGREQAKSIAMNGMPSWYDYEDQFLSQQMGRLPYYYYGEQLSNTDRVRGHLLLDRQYFVVKNKEVFVDLKTGDISEIPETWDRNRIARVLQITPGLGTMRRKMKTVRWDVTCEGEVLHSEDSPYKHFTVVPFFPEFVDGVSMGAVQSLLDPQAMFNKVTSQELHIINTTANSGWKVKQNALKNMTIEELEGAGARSGFVAELDDVNNMEKITPNATPQGHDRLSFKADQIMTKISGVSNQARGFAREDVAGEAIEQNQAAMDVNFAGYLSNLHRTKQLVARNVMDCVSTHYTETRTIQINRGSALVPNMEELTINQPTAEGAVLNDVTRGRYTTALVPSPSRTTMEEADFKLLLSLRKDLGIAIPDSMLIELSPASNKAQIINSLTQDSNERDRAAEAAAAAQAQAELATEQAKAQKEAAAAKLNDARADKFAVEAASDPDASYERVEQARIESDNYNKDADRMVRRSEIAEGARQANQSAAIELTKIEVTRESANADREVAKKDTRPSSSRSKKPGAKKSA